jgi:hypothetical protein
MRQAVIETAGVSQTPKSAASTYGFPVRRRALVVRGEQPRKLGFELLDHVVF